MAAPVIPEPPAQLKAIQSFVKTASDIERVDPVVSYWIRLYSTETALKIDKDSLESKAFLAAIINWLEYFKKGHKEDDRVNNPTVGQAHVDNFVTNLFNKADTADRNGSANKTTVTMFYISSILFESMVVFGPLTEENQKRSKYAKFKAAYIQKCLKTGQVPKPGPVDNLDLEEPGTSESAPSDQSSSLDQPSNPTNEPYSSPTNDITGSNDSSHRNHLHSNNTSFSNNNNNGGNQASLVLPETPDRDESSSPNNTNVANQSSASISTTKYHAINGKPLTVQDLVQGQKYCKFATSALQYDDVDTAVANLEKALRLLKTGEKSN